MLLNALDQWISPEAGALAPGQPNTSIEPDRFLAAISSAPLRESLAAAGAEYLRRRVERAPAAEARRQRILDGGPAPTTTEARVAAFRRAHWLSDELSVTEKALLCTRIAAAALGSEAPDAILEEYAFSLMSLDEDTVITLAGFHEVSL
jgi:hypothetical protein